MHWQRLLVLPIFCLLSLVQIVQSQSDFGLTSFSQLSASDFYHPGWTQSSGQAWELDLAHLSYQNYHSAANYHDLIEQTSDGPRIRLASLQEHVGMDNRLETDLRIRSIAIRRSWGTYFLEFSHTLNFQMDVDYPRSIIDLLVDGNAPYVGRNLDLSFNGEFSSFNDYGLAFGIRLGTVQFALRPRLLFGHQYLGMDTRTLSMYTDPAFYQIRLETDFDVRSVSSVDFSSESLLEYDFQGLRRWSLASSNVGLAIDAGGSLQVGAFTVGLGVRDLGFISWQDVDVHQSQKIQDYDGRSIPDLLDLESISIAAEVDSVRNLFAIQSHQDDFRQTLHGSGRLSISYQSDQKWQIALYLMYRDNSHAPWVMNMSLWHRLGGLLLGGSVGVQNNNLRFGAQAMAEYGAFRPYISLQNFAEGVGPLRSKDYQLSAGLSVVF